MRALKWLWKHTIFYQFYDMCDSFNEYLDVKELIGGTFYSNDFKLVMKEYLNIELREDWLGRLYGVINPTIDKDGHFNISNMILEIDGENTNSNEYVKTWAYKQLQLVAQLFKIESLYDFINVEFEHVGPPQFDNYLLVFDMVSRQVAAESTKTFFKHLLVLGLLAAAVVGITFLV